MKNNMGIVNCSVLDDEVKSSAENGKAVLNLLKAETKIFPVANSGLYVSIVGFLSGPIWRRPALFRPRPSA